MSSRDLSAKQRLFGRRISRPLGKDRQAAMASLLPVLGIPHDCLTNPNALDPASLFNTAYTDYQLEIGFGAGEHLLALIARYPETGFIGAEPFINGMAGFLKNLDQNQKNIRVLMDDALPLVQALKTESLGRIYILNPDPWPKKRHHKRRLLNQENLSGFIRVLKPNGRLIIATDVDDLAEWMLIQCFHQEQLEWLASAPQDWRSPPAEWIETRYAFKGRTAGRNQTFLIFRKKACKS